MAGSSHEKDNSPNDPVAETYDRPPTPDEPVGDEKHVIGESSKYEEPVGDRESVSEANEERARLDRTKSSVTDASVTTAATSRHPERDSKPWYKTPNPLRWGKIPPIPKERDVCPEYSASFFSMLFFQWMAPLMTVGLFPRPNVVQG
jgi:ATP-binding cassette subfamily C (CFTR/MRP) protein 1